GAANTSFPRDAAMAVDSMSRPTVAWVEDVLPEGSNYRNPQLVVQRWSGGQWSALGDAAGAPGTRSVTSPSLVMDSSDMPLVAFLQDDVVSVSRWNGTAWQSLGPPPALQDSDVPQGVSLALTPSGQPVVAVATKSHFYRSYDGVPRVYVFQWNESAWTQLGAPMEAGTGLGAARNPSLAIDRFGRAVVAWDAYNAPSSSITRGTVHVFRYEAGQWRRLGGVLNRTPENDYIVAEDPSLVVDPIDGTPSVAWIDQSWTTTNRTIFVARWSDANGEWTHLTDNGLDGWVDASTEAYGPSLAVGRDGSLVVTWNERSRDTPHFLRKWSGGQWSAFDSNPHGMVSSNYYMDSALALDVWGRPLLMSPISTSSPWRTGFYVRHFAP
ncbi:MAG TPA: hypothetical protein VF664_04135, partial [Cystobacter sp.]